MGDRAEGPDFAPGVVDAKYIQHFCPLLEELRALLLAAAAAARSPPGPPNGSGVPGVPGATPDPKVAGPVIRGLNEICVADIDWKIVSTYEPYEILLTHSPA